jgi:hypothetical protein
MPRIPRTTRRAIADCSARYDDISATISAIRGIFSDYGWELDNMDVADLTGEKGDELIGILNDSNCIGYVYFAWCIVQSGCFEITVSIVQEGEF